MSDRLVDRAAVTAGRLAVPAQWSRSARKRELYAIDPYFRDAYDDLTDLFGPPATSTPVLHRMAPLVLRPDAIATGRAADVLGVVGEHGLVAVGIATFRFTRHVIRETWRYQLNIATRDRIDVMDMIMSVGRALYVLLTPSGPAGPVPATVSLNALKGPSQPELRRPRHLRTIAGPGQESVLTYVHVADEPADVVRDLGVFFDRGSRLRLLRSARDGGDVTERLRAELAALHGAVPATAFSFDHAVAGLDRLLRAAAPSGGRSAAARMLALIRTGRSDDWRALLAAVDNAGVPWPHWDRVAVAARLSARHHDERPAVDDIDPAEWEAASCRS